MVEQVSSVAFPFALTVPPAGFLPIRGCPSCVPVFGSEITRKSSLRTLPPSSSPQAFRCLTLHYLLLYSTCSNVLAACLSKFGVHSIYTCLMAVKHDTISTTHWHIYPYLSLGSTPCTFTSWLYNATSHGHMYPHLSGTDWNRPRMRYG